MYLTQKCNNYFLLKVLRYIEKTYTNDLLSLETNLTKSLPPRIIKLGVILNHFHVPEIHAARQRFLVKTVHHGRSKKNISLGSCNTRPHETKKTSKSALTPQYFSIFQLSSG